MARSAAEFGAPSFVVSCGGNFLPGGLEGARPTPTGPFNLTDLARALTSLLSSPLRGAGPAFTTDNDIRMTHSFDTAFIYPPLQVPWYIAPGTPDWQGNVTGAKKIQNTPLRPRFASRATPRAVPLARARRRFQLRPLTAGPAAAAPRAPQRKSRTTGRSRATAGGTCRPATTSGRRRCPTVRA